MKHWTYNKNNNLKIKNINKWHSKYHKDRNLKYHIKIKQKINVIKS